MFPYIIRKTFKSILINIMSHEEKKVIREKDDEYILYSFYPHVFVLFL